MSKKYILTTVLFSFIYISASAQEFKIVTVIESIVPMGIGRSRIVEAQGKADINVLSTTRNGNKSNQSEVDRDEIKEIGENMTETKLLNFYSLVGINFGNVASNDAVISAKINQVIKEGWTLAYVTSAVESDSGKDDGKGIFITRLFFSKK